MIDVKEHISAVRREVGTRTLEAGEARVVTIMRTYDAPVDDVWDACTDIERIPRWFAPVTGDLRVGGRYQVQGNAGGLVERCDPPRSFAATWEFGGQVSGIEVRLDPAEDGTLLTLEHVGHVDDEFWGQFGPGRGRRRVGAGAARAGRPPGRAWGAETAGRRGLGGVRRGPRVRHAQRRGVGRGARRGRRGSDGGEGVGGPDGGLLHGRGEPRRGRGARRAGRLTAGCRQEAILHVVR